MEIVFVFNGRHGVNAYLRKLKGVLMWQFSLLEQVETLFLGGVFVLPIGNSTHSTTHVVQLVGDHTTLSHPLCKQCFLHTFINIIVCFHQRERERVNTHIHYKNQGIQQVIDYCMSCGTSDVNDRSIRRARFRQSGWVA